MWDVAREVVEGGDGPSEEAVWRVANVRLEFGPAKTVGDLLASLSEVLTFSRLLPYDLEFFEAPEGTYMYTHCEMPQHDIGLYETLSPLLARDWAAA